MGLVLQYKKSVKSVPNNTEMTKMRNVPEHGTSHAFLHSPSLKSGSNTSPSEQLNFSVIMPLSHCKYSEQLSGLDIGLAPVLGHAKINMQICL